MLGLGIFTKKQILKRQFICEYAGELLTFKDGESREVEYKESELGSFLFFFDYHGRKHW